VRLEGQQRKIIITILIVISFYVVFATFSDFGKIEENYYKIKLFYLVPIFGIFIFSIFIRSLLQRFLLKNIGIELTVRQSFLIFRQVFQCYLLQLGLDR